MYSKILVPVDLDDPSSWAKSVPAACELAACFKADVGLVYVVPDRILALQAQWSELGVERILDTAYQRLARLADELAGPTRIDAHVTNGNVCAGIIDLVHQQGADLVVLASHRPALKDYLIGPIAGRVVRHAPCSVMVVR